MIPRGRVKGRSATRWQEHHKRLLEGDQDAGQAGQAGADDERVQFRQRQVDAERGRRSLVRPQCDQLAPDPAAAQIGDHERADDEQDQAEHRVAPGMCECAEVVAEHRGLPHCEPGPLVLQTGIAEQDVFDRQAKSERGDRQVHSAGAERGQANDRAYGQRHQHACD